MSGSRNLGATLRIVRPRGYWNSRFGSFVIFLDGQAQAKVRYGQEVNMPVAAGTHEIWASLSKYWTSPMIRLTLEQGGVRSLLCYPRFRIGSGLLRRADYLVLEPAAGEKVED